MKIALLMGGEYRTFDDSFRNWLDRCLTHFGYDLFLSTWSKTNAVSDKFGDIIPSEVTQDRVQQTMGDKSPYFLNIEEEIKFFIRPNKQLYHWHRLLTNLINVKDQYDFVILTRPDVFIFNENLDIVNFIKTCDKTKLYGPNRITLNTPDNYHMFSVHDIYFMGSPNNIIDSLLPIPYIKTNIEKLNAGTADSMHTHLANYFVQNNIYIHSYAPGSIIDSSWHKRILEEK